MGNRHKRIVTSCSALAGALLVAGTPASAQELEADAAAQNDDASGNTIIVTGLRRADELQDTPVAITAFTRETIENARIIRPADFVALTPNVNLVETQNAGNAFIIIRGITQARNSEPSVAVVVDGVQQVNPAQFNQELFDLEQIEVFKGPQGGLYGRNAIGGAIVITTQQPGDVLEGKVTAGIDNGFGYFLRGGLGGPLADAVKFRLSGSYYDTDGFIPNVFLGEEADPLENFSLRGNLLIEPADRWEVDLRGSLNLLRTQALYFNIVSDVNDTSLPVRVNNAGQNDRDIYNLAAKVTYAGDNVELTSITSWDKLTEILTGDAFDFLPIPESLFFFLFGEDWNQSQYLNTDSFSQGSAPAIARRCAAVLDGRRLSGGHRPLHLDRQHGRYRCRRVPRLSYAEHQSGQPAAHVPVRFAGQLRLGAVRQSRLRDHPRVPRRRFVALRQ